MTLLYRWRVRCLKVPALNVAWRYWKAWTGHRVGAYHELRGMVWERAAGGTFADIGCMWGVNGEFSFVAEAAGATEVTAVDVFGPTPEFEAERLRRSSRVQFVLGDILDGTTVRRIGVVDTVLCAGVLYHLPDPFALLAALRRICGKTLILRTSTIPEFGGLPHAAVYYPLLGAADRQLWDLRSLGVPRQVGITDAFDPLEGYGNYFWGLTPSCVEALLATAGFRVDFRAIEAFAHTVVCSPVEPPVTHPLPDEAESRAMAAEISKAGIARPA